MHVARTEVLPPSGVQFVTVLKLTSAALQAENAADSPTSSKNVFFSRVIHHLVLARSNLLRIFEIREEPAPVPAGEAAHERERRGSVRKGTEAVEGETEMDQDGEGFIGVGGSVKSTDRNATVTRFRFLREHRLHGTVTGMDRVTIVSSAADGLDRLLISFEDAKIALLEWSEDIHDLLTVSIHTYERAPQLMSLDTSLFRGWLRVDPFSRCAALCLPRDAFAILPFHQELETMDADPQGREVPYAPSYVLDLPEDVDTRIRNVLDLVFLPGFNTPTVAVLCQPVQTWTGRLAEYKDTAELFVFELGTLTRSYPLLAHVAGLPYDSRTLHACPASTGGVLVLAPDALVHVSTSGSGRRVALPVSGWAARSSALEFLSSMPTSPLKLEGARLAFIDARKFCVFAADGHIHPVELHLDGATVVGMALSASVAQTTIPEVVCALDDERLFVGSSVASSVLLRAVRVEEEVPVINGVNGHTEGPTAVADVSMEGTEMDDDFDDIYGASKHAHEPVANGNITAVAKRTVIHFSVCDSLPAYGPIADMAFSISKNGDRIVPELVCATGSGHLGGFTLFQRDLPTRVKKKLHALGGGRGLWSLALKQSVKVNGVSYDRPTDPLQADNDTVIVSTDVNPSPGVSRFSHRSAKTDVAITTRAPGTTIGAGPFFQRTAILHVMTNAIRLLHPDGAERQVIKDLDGNMTRPKIRHCSICDPFVLIIREDDTLGLFIGESERGKIRRKDMSPLGDKTSRYLTGCFFADKAGIFDVVGQPKVSATPIDTDGNATATMQGVLNTETRSQWLFLVRPSGTLEIWTLPKLALVYSIAAAADLDHVLYDSLDPPVQSASTEPQNKAQELDIEQMQVCLLGESAPQPHLILLLRSGQLAVYEAVRSVPLANASRQTLNVRFVKCLSRVLDIQRSDAEHQPHERSVLAEQRKISRLFVPFSTVPSPGCTLLGAFLTGDRPCWILRTDRAGTMLHSGGYQVVHAFTACSLWESKADFMLYTEEGPTLLDWLPHTDVNTLMPSRSVPRSRPYSNVMFDITTGLIVAASSLEAKFASYDEDNNIVWEPDGEGVNFPMSACSTLELISSDQWITMDGFEFATNEFVNSVESVPLETSSTESGLKDFIAVGTSIDRGEDLAVKGATYIFEIVEVVPDTDSAMKRWYKLKLRCRDDAKGPVTAICGMNGYLVSSMGQKLFVRAFDQDERLVGVAFLDVGVYVTSLRAVKNILLIGDAAKSVWFVAFQEDPFKLVVLSKDFSHICVTTADLMFGENQMAIVTSDEQGVIRIYQYDPNDPESRNGQQLMCRTEFDGQVDSRTSISIARRSGEEQALPQAKLILGSSDGSLTALTPVDESMFKRLQLLQGQLARNVQHIAGLNPRAFRIVRNDHYSKPLSKGILDGNLLTAFLALPVARQEEMTRQIATQRTDVLKDWTSLGHPW